MGIETSSQRIALRAEAERRIRKADVAQEASGLDPASLADLLHELRVHQLELEAQNDELLRTQVELAESRDRYRDLFDTAPVGYLCLTPDGRIVAANLTASVLFGCQRDELIGRPLQLFVSADDAVQLHWLFREVIGRRIRQESDLRISATDGSTTYLHIQCMPGSDADQHDGQIRMTLSDVTSLKQAEECRAEVEQKLQQKQRLASLGVLAGGIAHDFNNLLFGITTHAELLLLTAPTPAQQVSVDQIKVAATRSAELCSQMLDFSGKRQFEETVFRLSDVVDGLAGLLLPTLHRKRVELNFIHAADSPTVEGDVTGIRQVAMNIMLNAAEALEEHGGSVAVKTGLLTIDPHYLAANQLNPELPGGEYAYLQVEDSGCGIDQENLNKVFDPYFTSKFSGRGLGLASVSGIVRSHGGSITIESSVGSGTTVCVLLPVSANSITEDSSSVVQGPAAERLATVLLVDDDASIRMALMAKLEMQGYVVITAVDGASAVLLAEQHRGKVDIVVLDLTMPGLSTAEICRSLHDTAPDLPVLLMSGFSQEEALDSCEYKNIAGFVAKPLGDVAKAINRVLVSAE